MHVKKALRMGMSGRWSYLPTGMDGKPAVGMKSICSFCSRTYWM